MDLVQAKERYKSIIKMLILEQDFGNFLFDDRNYDGFMSWHSKHEELFNESFYIAHGLTKAVIVIKETGFVVKIPFSNLKQDYCEEELSIYCLASDCGVADVFAWCEKFFSIEKDNETVDSDKDSKEDKSHTSDGSNLAKIIGFAILGLSQSLILKKKSEK